MSFDILDRNQIFIKLRWIILKSSPTNIRCGEQNQENYTSKNFTHLDAEWNFYFQKYSKDSNYGLLINCSKYYSSIKILAKIKILECLSTSPFEASCTLVFEKEKYHIFPLKYMICPNYVHIEVEMTWVPDPTILSLLLPPLGSVTAVKGNTSASLNDAECQTSKQDEMDEPYSCYNTSNLVKDLNAGYEESVLFDVKLKVADHELPAHKFLLACRSPVFRKMFEEDMKEKHGNTANLPNMEVPIAKELLRFIYTGKVFETSLEAVMKLYVAADRFYIPTLKDLCRRLMINGLSVQSVGGIAVLADLHSDNLLDEATMEFLQYNLMKVLKNPEWQKLKEMKPAFCIDLLEKVFKTYDDKE